MTKISGCPRRLRSGSHHACARRGRSPRRCARASSAASGDACDARRPQHGARARCAPRARRSRTITPSCVDAVPPPCSGGRSRPAARASAWPSPTGSGGYGGSTRSAASSRMISRVAADGWRGSRAQRVVGDLAQRAGELDAGRPGADHDERQPGRRRSRGSVSRSAASKASRMRDADLGRILDGLQARRARLPLVVAEVVVRGAGRDDQRVVRRARRRSDARAGASTSMSTTSPSSTRVLRWRLSDVAQRRGDLAGREPAGGDLIEQRLEEVEVAPVDQRDLHRRAAQRLRRVEPAETAADDDDPGCRRRHARYSTSLMSARHRPAHRQRRAVRAPLAHRRAGRGGLSLARAPRRARAPDAAVGARRGRRAQRRHRGRRARRAAHGPPAARHALGGRAPRLHRGRAVSRRAGRRARSRTGSTRIASTPDGRGGLLSRGSHRVRPAVRRARRARWAAPLTRRRLARTFAYRHRVTAQDIAAHARAEEIADEDSWSADRAGSSAARWCRSSPPAATKSCAWYAAAPRSGPAPCAGIPKPARSTPPRWKGSTRSCTSPARTSPRPLDGGEEGAHLRAAGSTARALLVERARRAGASAEGARSPRRRSATTATAAPSCVDEDSAPGAGFLRRRRARMGGRHRAGRRRAAFASSTCASASC